jgi:threonine dehydrogenase-like Zn-dependent dehydrogenase
MDRCLTINNGREDAVAVVRDLTGALGADVAIEAVGVPATVELAPALARPGGRIANIGVHGQPATLHLEDLWIRNVGSSSSAVGRHTTTVGPSPRRPTGSAGGDLRDVRTLAPSTVTCCG